MWSVKNDMKNGINFVNMDEKHKDLQHIREILYLLRGSI